MGEDIRDEQRDVEEALVRLKWGLKAIDKGGCDRAIGELLQTHDVRIIPLVLSEAYCVP